MENESQAVADCERQDWRATSANFPPAKGKHGSERRDRDDEEVQRRIPTPLSDDSSTWLDEFLEDESKSKQEEETQPGSGLNLKQAFLKLEKNETIKKTRHKHERKTRKGHSWSPNPLLLAFLIGPRLDGIMRMKSGQPIYTTDPPIPMYKTETQQLEFATHSETGPPQ
jgi:hypothetical protein